MTFVEDGGAVRQPTDDSRIVAGLPGHLDIRELGQRRRCLDDARPRLRRRRFTWLRRRPFRGALWALRRRRGGALWALCRGGAPWALGGRRPRRRGALWALSAAR